jgi:hypothetical protein
MKAFQRAAIDEDDVSAPDGIQREMMEIASIVNGHLDQDNLQDDLLTAGKTASGAWQNINWTGTTSADTVSGAASTPTSTWFDVPDLSIETQTQDGMLQIETSGYYDCNTTVEFPIVVAICVDGAKIVMSPPTSLGPEGQWWVTAEAPVGGGTHTINVQFAHTDNPGTGTVGVAWEREFHARQLWVREIKR